MNPSILPSWRTKMARVWRHECTHRSLAVGRIPFRCEEFSGTGTAAPENRAVPLASGGLFIHDEGMPSSDRRRRSGGARRSSGSPDGSTILLLPRRDDTRSTRSRWSCCRSAPDLRLREIGCKSGAPTRWSAFGFLAYAVSRTRHHHEVAILLARPEPRWSGVPSGVERSIACSLVRRRPSPTELRSSCATRCRPPSSPDASIVVPRHGHLGAVNPSSP